MGQLEGQLSGQLSASTRFRQLERDARLKRQVYEDFAEQAQRASEQAGVQLPDVFLASQASAPLRPVSPNRPFVLLISTLVGLLAGFAVGIVRSLAGTGEARLLSRTVQVQG
jgi:tyrosine-protein kinase Etk/Wzc